MKYYGIDWIVCVLVLSSIYLTAHKKSSGFLVGAASAIAGIIFSYFIDSWANGICSLAVLLFNLWAYRKWQNEGV